MKRIVGMLLLLSVIVINMNILPVFAEDECISENKIVTVKSGSPSVVGEPGNLVDGKTKTDDSCMYYQWNWAPWFCIDLGGYYEISGLKWISRYENTTGELEASIYGAVSEDWSDKELINQSESCIIFEYELPENSRPVYRYIIVQRPEKGCGIGGKEFYVYGKNVSENYTTDKAQDYDNSTYWMSGSNENYLQLDLGEESVIKAVELSARHDKDNVDERTNFEIWLSNDEKFDNYVIVPCVSSLTNTDRVRVGKPYDFKETYRKEIDLPDKYRYVRYVKFSGIATLAQINVLTGEEEVIEHGTTVTDFCVNSEFIDSAGDITNVFVPGSDIEFRGDIKNNTEKDTDIYVFAAAYDDNGILAGLSVKERSLKKGDVNSFTVKVNAGDGRVCGFIWEKKTMKSICDEKNIPKYTEMPNAVYVSGENGDDNNDGSVLAPFKTIERAKEAVNEIKENGESIIRIKNGKYSVSTAIEITAADSGSENGYIKYEGFGTDETVLSTGKSIGGFVKGNDGVYCANVSGLESINDIYVNGERRNIASTKILTAKDEIYDEEKQIYGPVITKEQLPEGIEYSIGMEIYYPSVNWRSYSLKLEQITDYDDESYILNVQKSTPVIDRNTYNLLEKFDARAFYLRNSPELLNEEGEWYFNKESSVLYYKPYSFENMESVEVTASGIDTLINIKNAEYISFDGLTFAHTGWSAAKQNGDMRWQGHNQVLQVEYAAPPAALYAKYSRNIDITNCIFKNIGAVGIGFDWGMKNCNINGNVFYDIADGAMYLGNYRDIENSKFGKSEADLLENINIKNNVITDTGKEYHTSSALQLYAGKNVNIEYNDISHCPYSAISVGPLVWSNALADSEENHEAGMYGYNRICNNSIHETNKLNVDGGAIYTLGHNHGTVISGNYIKNQYMDYGAIYNDKGSACFEIYDNVMENVPGWLYEWSEEIYFIKAYNNYSTTNETYGGLFCSKSDIDDVEIFSDYDKTEDIKSIISDAGLQSNYKLKIGKYIPHSPQKVSPVFSDNIKMAVSVGEKILLTADFSANDSGRYRWKATGKNKANVTFKDTLHGWLKKGRQFEKIYASFSAAGDYEIICEADDERGYIYASKQYITVN